MYKLIFRFLFCIILVSCSFYSFSQDILKGKDLSQLKVDELSDADIIKYQQQFKQAGLNEAQAEQLALSKGLPLSQIAKLHERIAALTDSQSLNQNNSKTTPNKRTYIQESNENIPVSNEISINSKIFGYELFSSASLSFQPDLKIATPANYQLGPDDELQISVYGLQVFSTNVTVSAEGVINIPNVGEIQISGYTIEEARERIKSRMSPIYTSLRSGRSKLSINLGKIRSIHVTILGSAKPGTYVISSLSTLFNALYLSGGPGLNGSFREIQILRQNKIERTIDLYNFLLSGNEIDNIRLRENDIIRIPVYKNRAEIAGEIKRPGIFEMLPGETLNDLLKFANGFTDSAYKASIKVIQLTDKEKKVKDIKQSGFSLYNPQPADFFQVSRILNRFENRVTISGAVFRPGVFEITPNLTVGQLIKNAEGLKEDAYSKRAQLIRLNKDNTSEIISFDVAQVIEGRNDILLNREDKVIITSIFDLKDEFVISIQGEVRHPGNYNFIDRISLKDLILQAGGFTDAAFPQRIEIARHIRRDTLTMNDVRLSEIIDVNDINDLSLNSQNIELKPSDVITVRRKPGYLSLSSVTINGQVQYPGPYVLAKRAERISDLLKRSGGLTPEAFPEGSFLKRLNDKNNAAGNNAIIVKKIQQQLKDSTGHIEATLSESYDQIPLDLSIIMANPSSDMDFILKSGDEIFIPRNDEEIKINGEVLYPTEAPYNRKNKFKDYISDAGGFSDNASKNKVYVLYRNGKAAKTNHFLFIRHYPIIKPGSQIIVPVSKERRKGNTAETLGLASAIASMAGVIIAIIKLIKP